MNKEEDSTNSAKSNLNVFAIPLRIVPVARYSKEEDEQKYRNPFAKDRDRILYSRAFRRLSGKTQVFLSSNIDDVRTRLTHTLEVNQIAVTIATALNLNTELTEAIALGHDVGHTPFGHVGERTLNRIMNGCDDIGDISACSTLQGFKHNLQSLRVLCDLEDGNDCMGRGLNLSKYTLWGIVNHSSLDPRTCKLMDDGLCYEKHRPSTCIRNGQLSCSFYDKYIENIGWNKYWSFEGLIVAQADEIAQRHHDIEDSLNYNIIKIQMIVELITKYKDLFISPEDDENYISLLEKQYDEGNRFVKLFSRFIVNFYVVHFIEQISKIMGDLVKSGISSLDKTRSDDVYFKVKNGIMWNGKLKDFDIELTKFLKDNVLSSYKAQIMDGKGGYIVRRLFQAYYSNPNQLSDDAIRQFYMESHLKINDSFRSGLKKAVVTHKSALMRIIADYIGGMTDSQAYQQYDVLYGTRTD